VPIQTFRRIKLGNISLIVTIVGFLQFNMGAQLGGTAGMSRCCSMPPRHMLRRWQLGCTFAPTFGCEIPTEHTL
jgi:hypothetical protein